jgi:hypothetical protein
VRAVHVDDHPGHRRSRVVEPHPDAFYAVSAQQEMFLFRVRESSWKGEYEPIGIRSGLNRGLYGPGQDYFDSYIRALALYLQLLNLGRAAFSALGGSIGTQQQEHKK